MNADNIREQKMAIKSTKKSQTAKAQKESKTPKAKTLLTPPVFLQQQLTITYVPVAGLVPYARNSRTHSKNQIAQIAASIKEFGWTSAIALDGNNGIIAGHGRVEAARLLGIATVPTVDLSHLTEIQRKAYVIADNKIALNAGWSEDLLKLELEELQVLNYNLDLTGFSELEISDMFMLTSDAGNAPEDEIPKPAAHSFSVLGDIWILGNHRVMCGSSTQIDDLEKLLKGRKAEMLFTDPPYGCDYQGGHFHSGNVNIKRKREKLANDETVDIYGEFLTSALSFLDVPGYIWYTDTSTYEVFKALKDNDCSIHAEIIWHKTNATYAAMNKQYKQRHEPCVYFKPNNGSTLRWVGASDENTLWEEKRDASNEYHPTQKPVALAERAIKNHESQIILDCFGGSGSTLIACEKLARSARLMEISPSYVDTIVRRWEAFAGKKAILESTGQTFEELQKARPAN